MNHTTHADKPVPATRAAHQALSLRVNFSWTFVGNIIYAACQWGMLIVLARLGSPEMVGQFALGLAVTAPLFMFSNLQLRGVQATDARQDYRFGDYLGLRLMTTLLALLVLVGIVVVSGYAQTTMLVVLGVGFAKGFEAVSDVFYGLLQQRERMDRIALSKIIKGLLSLVVLGAGVYFTGSVVWGIFGLALVWAGILVFYDVASAHRILQHPMKNDATGEAAMQGSRSPEHALSPSWQRSTLGRLTWLALPLGLVMMLISLNTNIPRYFIEYFLGIEELGIFAALAYLMVAGNVVINALGQAASPRLAKQYAAGNRAAFLRLLGYLMGIGAVLGAGAVGVAVVAGEPILTLLYGAEYARQDLFVWLMVAAMVFYVASFLGHGMTAARYFKVQFPLFVVVTITTTLACFWLIPEHGLYGGAMALMIAAVVQIIGSLAIVIYAVRQIGQNTV